MTESEEPQIPDEAAGSDPEGRVQDAEEPEDASRSIHSAQPKREIQLSDAVTGLGEWRMRLANQSVFAEAFRNLRINETFFSAAFAQMKLLDGLTPSILKSVQLDQMSRISEAITGISALSTWRSALVAQDHIREILGPMTALHEQLATAVRPLMLEIAAISDTSVRLSQWAAELDAGRRMLGVTAALPFEQWQQTVSGLHTTTTELQAWRFAGLSGHGALGLLAADTVDDRVDDQEANLTTLVDVEVVESWTNGHVSWQAELLDAVGALDSQVPELLQGAWDDVQRQGPAAVSKICNCIVEALDRALRAAAPDDDVRSWFESAKRPASDWDAAGKHPTRALRIRYVVHVRQLGGGDVIEAQADALITMNRALMSDAQSAKHASTGTVARARSLLVAAEVLLSMLFCRT